MAKGEWWVDVPTLCEKLCISERFFYSHFNKDPRVEVFKVSRGSKNWFESKKIEPVLSEIMYELDK